MTMTRYDYDGDNDVNFWDVRKSTNIPKIYVYMTMVKFQI